MPDDAQIHSAEVAENLVSHVVQRRGKLKIFLGMAAGVGKTYTMLAEAHRRVSRGEDVVIGYVEPHARPETAALEEGLELIAPKAIEYRGTTFLELDTEAVIRRRPEWVLVDELAHTNVPGASHPKRWQSIEVLRDAGINVDLDREHPTPREPERRRVRDHRDPGARDVSGQDPCTRRMRSS